jgi:hypothetical protein
MQRSAIDSETKDQATRPILVLGIVRNDFAAHRDRLFHLGHTDASYDGLIHGVLRELVLPRRDLPPDVTPTPVMNLGGGIYSPSNTWLKIAGNIIADNRVAAPAVVGGDLWPLALGGGTGIHRGENILIESNCICSNWGGTCALESFQLRC